MRLSAGDDSYLVLSVIDVDPVRKPELIAVLTAGHEQSVREIPGFQEASVLAGIEGGRLVTVSRWVRQADFLRALQDEEALRYIRQTTAVASELRTCTYRLVAVRTAGGDGAVELFPDPDLHTGLIWGRADDRAKRDMILEYNSWETERVISSFDGFRFATFLSGHDDRDWAEITQWQSTEQFLAAFQDEAFQEHLPVNDHYTIKDVSFHRVVAAATT